MTTVTLLTTGRRAYRRSLETVRARLGDDVELRLVSWSQADEPLDDVVAEFVVINPALEGAPQVAPPPAPAGSPGATAAALERDEAQADEEARAGSEAEVLALDDEPATSGVVHDQSLRGDRPEDSGTHAEGDRQAPAEVPAGTAAETPAETPAETSVGTPGEPSTGSRPRPGDVAAASVADADGRPTVLAPQRRPRAPRPGRLGRLRDRAGALYWSARRRAVRLRRRSHPRHLARQLRRTRPVRVLRRIAGRDVPSRFADRCLTDPAIVRMLATSDVVVALDVATIRTAWRVGRRTDRPDVVYGIDAAERVVARRRTTTAQPAAMRDAAVPGPR